MKSKKEIIGTILSIKIGIFLLIFVAYSLLPFGKDFYIPNFVYPPKSPITLETAYKTWDAQHYLFLSEKGYEVNADSDAFPPLFPFLIHLASFLTRSSFWSAILLSNVFSVIGLYIFYRFVSELYSEKVGYRSLLFLLAFPTAFYFSLIYTESLFFLLIMLFFVFFQKRKLLLTSLIGFLLPITRLIGAAILIPSLFVYILEYHKHSLYDELRVIRKSFFQRKTLLLFTPIGGIVFCMVIFYMFTGSFFTEFTAQRNFISQYSFFSLFNPFFFFRALFTFPLHLHGFTDSVLDRLFFLSFLILLIPLYKRVSIVFFVYALCFGLIPVLSGSFMSYMRYLLVVFPIFITLGKMSLEKKYQPHVFPFFFLSMMLQTLFLIMHSLNYWVS